MPPAARRAANLLHGASARISDQLLIVVDFALLPEAMPLERGRPAATG